MTLCISSQAGCALQCAFCATGRMGFQRNLSAWEIAGRVRDTALLDPPIAVTNVVFMGMGEPMINWPAVDTALTILNSPQGLGIGARHITVSTVGVLPGSVALGERPEQFRLAISIHAPSDELRRELMPVNIKYPLANVIAQARTFDRRVTFEYVMLGDVNDGPEHARQLAALARSCRAFVNLIPLHEGGALSSRARLQSASRLFARALREAGVEVAVRKSRGKDVAAACGQLRVERLGRGAQDAPMSTVRSTSRELSGRTSTVPPPIAFAASTAQSAMAGSVEHRGAVELIGIVPWTRRRSRSVAKRPRRAPCKPAHLRGVQDLDGNALSTGPVRIGQRRARGGRGRLCNGALLASGVQCAPR